MGAIKTAFSTITIGVGYVFKGIASSLYGLCVGILGALIVFLGLVGISLGLNIDISSTIVGVITLAAFVTCFVLGFLVEVTGARSS